MAMAYDEGVLYGWLNEPVTMGHGEGPEWPEGYNPYDS